MSQNKVWLFGYKLYLPRNYVINKKKTKNEEKENKIKVDGQYKHAFIEQFLGTKYYD